MIKVCNNMICFLAAAYSADILLITLLCDVHAVCKLGFNQSFKKLWLKVSISITVFVAVDFFSRFP